MAGEPRVTSLMELLSTFLGDFPCCNRPWSIHSCGLLLGSLFTVCLVKFWKLLTYSLRAPIMWRCLGV